MNHTVSSAFSLLVALHCSLMLLQGEIHPLCGGRLELKLGHDYYYQIQGMLHIMNVDVCHFGVWTPSQFHHQLVTRNTKLWDNEMFPKLLTFYRLVIKKQNVLGFPKLFYYRKYILEDKWKIPDMNEDEMELKKIEILEKLRYFTLQ